MSKFYKENNNESTFELFNKNIIYTRTIFETEYPNLTNFYFAEKALYGKVNRNFSPIVLNPNLSMIKQFKSSAVPEQNLKTLAFVVDAFEAMVQQFKKAQLLGRIDPNDSNLSDLKVFKTHKDYNINYQNYQKEFISAFKEVFNKEKIC